MPEVTQAQIQRDYPPARYTVAVLQLSLTLVPDHDYRFRTADLIMTLESDDSLFIHPKPTAQTTTVTVTEHDAHGTLKATIPTASEIGLGTRQRDTEVSPVETTIEASGINTAEAGWRLAAGPYQRPRDSARHHRTSRRHRYAARQQTAFNQCHSRDRHPYSRRPLVDTGPQTQQHHDVDHQSTSHLTAYGRIKSPTPPRHYRQPRDLTGWLPLLKAKGHDGDNELFEGVPCQNSSPIR